MYKTKKDRDTHTCLVLPPLRRLLFMPPKEGFERFERFERSAGIYNIMLRRGRGRSR